MCGCAVARCARLCAHRLLLTDNLQYFAALGDLEIARLERQRMGDALAHAYTEVRACVRACVRAWVGLLRYRPGGLPLLCLPAVRRRAMCGTRSRSCGGIREPMAANGYSVVL